MKPGIARSVLGQMIRYLGVTQAGGVVVLHGAWIILALATWQQADAGHGPVTDFTRAAFRTYAWLGGSNNGRGGTDEMLLVWGRISLVFYFFDVVLRRLAGDRPPVRIWLAASVSGLVSVLGYGLSFWRELGTAEFTGLLVFTLVFSVLAALAMVWALLARRLAEFVVRRLEAPRNGAT